jgi:hypothetical protein
MNLPVNGISQYIIGYFAMSMHNPFNPIIYQRPMQRLLPFYYLPSFMN